MYIGYGIAFDEIGSWNFGNGFARKVITFTVDNSSSSHTDNRKNNYLLLGEGSTYDINASFGSPVKNLVLVLVNQNKILLEFTLQS